MNAREQARFDALKRVAVFGTNITGDLTTPKAPAVSVSAAQTKAKTLFDKLSTPDTGIIALIAKNAGSQAAGSATSQSGTTSKAVLRDAIFLDLKAINLTAAAIATEQKTPDFMEKFRMPHGATDVELVAKEGAIATAAEAKLSNFTDFGMDGVRDRPAGAYHRF